VCFSAIFCGVIAFKHFAPPYVFFVRHGFKMVWIDTRSKSALMIWFHALRNLPFIKPIRKPMAENPFPFQAKLAVSQSRKSADPNPAA